MEDISPEKESFNASSMAAAHASEFISPIETVRLPSIVVTCIPLFRESGIVGVILSSGTGLGLNFNFTLSSPVYPLQSTGLSPQSRVSVPLPVISTLLFLMHESSAIMVLFPSTTSSGVTTPAQLGALICASLPNVTFWAATAKISPPFLTVLRVPFMVIASELYTPYPVPKFSPSATKPTRRFF